MEKCNYKNFSFKKRLVLIIIIIALLLLGLLILMMDFSNIVEQKEGLIESYRDPLVLEKEYKDSFSVLINDYLADSLSADLSEKTEIVKDKLLMLMVPSKYKENHLEAILTLDKIQRIIIGSQKGELELEMAKINKLREEINSL